MNLKRFSQSIILRARQLAIAIREVVPEARQAAPKPAVLGHILLTAHRSQITLAILLIILIFVAPTIVHFFTSAIFPPESSKKLFGLVTRHQANSWGDAADKILMLILWISSIGSAMLLLWLHIPKGLASANARARRLIEGLNSSANDPGCRKIFELALSLTTDPQLESKIVSRLHAATGPDTSRHIDDGTRVEPASDMNPDSETCMAEPQAARQANMSKSIGQNGRYRLEVELGKGAMGLVYGARDTMLDRDVAIKQLSIVLSDDEQYASRFVREARALARLTHPNIVQVYDLIEEGGRFWMVLEFVDGGDLGSFLKDTGRLSIGEAAGIIVPVAEGLAHAHGQGIVHRDLKPSNILLTSKRVPKISDFGIAKLSQSSMLTQVGSVLGSPRYMSPEQCSGNSVDAKTDIYSLGITLYELLTGNVPFEGDTSSVMARQIIERPQPLSEHLEHISADVESLILSMLAKSPGDRPADMMSIADRLSRYRNEVAHCERSTSS